MEQRTDIQNAALHLYFSNKAKELNDAGLDQRVVLKPSISIPWTAESVKKQLWKPIMEAMTGKISTTELDTKEVNQIYEVLEQHMGLKFHTHTEFPTDQEQMIRDIFNN